MSELTVRSSVGAVSRSTWFEPGRELPVLGRPEVLVVGAGAAGIAAALASARRGADTWLVERLSYVGGLASLGLINLLLTLDDGEGNQVVAGICQEVVDELADRGAAAFPPTAEWGSQDPGRIDHWRRWGLVWGAPPEVVRYSVAFEPEALITLAYDLLDAAGVRLRLHTWCTAAHAADGRIDAVVVESKAGREVLLPRVVIDTTGDADVLTLAGGPFERVDVHPYQWFRLGGVGDLDGEPLLGHLLFRTTDPGRVLVPWGGPGMADAKIDPCDPDALTRTEVGCRRKVMAAFDQLRATVPACRDAWLDGITTQLGITESRRMVGDYVLQKDDGDRPFADAVARTGHWTKRGVVYDIPYRCLTTSTVGNLLVAGRCLSTSRYVHQATKEIPAAMATGEAAGAAAALAIRSGVAERVGSLDVTLLRSDLAAGGAIVGGADR